MNMHIPAPPKRIVAPGGPVSAAIAAGRGEGVADQRDRIRRLADSIRHRIALDLALIDSLERAAGRLANGGAA